MSSQVAENYQLKWHSHLTNLNTSVSTLYRNEKFADVMLFASNSEGGVGIPAHKIILSSCSHMTDYRWMQAIMNWNSSPIKRGSGRPPERWINSIVLAAGTKLQQVAMDRSKWKEKGEAYIQQLILNG